MAPNLDPFGRDRAAYQELSKQRRVAEREARRYLMIFLFFFKSAALCTVWNFLLWIIHHLGI